jgi:hypothetical protein
MWWMYIGLGVVVATLVVFVFTVLAASSTDAAESPHVPVDSGRR